MSPTKIYELLHYITDKLHITILGGIKLTGLDRLKVTLKLVKKESKLNPFRHNLDLHNSIQTSQLIERSADYLDIATTEVSEAINELTTALETYRGEHLEALKPKPIEIRKLTETEHNAALAFLKSHNLLKQTQQAIAQSGIIGEKTNALIAYLYYSNGKIQSKRYYHLDTLDGLELKYYDNGKLSYQASIRNNKRYGGVYLYSIDGTLNSYSCFDINGNTFSTFDYNSSGDIIKISSPISLTTYSIDTRSNAIVLIGFVNKYINTKDLFMTVGTPPGTRLEINAHVNGVDYTGLKIVNNTIRINNAFPNKGINKIYLKVNMFYKKKEIIDGLNVDASILRE